AVTALARLITQIETCCADLPNVTINIACVEATGPLNVVPDLAIARLNARVTIAAEQHEVERRLHAAAALRTQDSGLSTELFGHFGAPPKPLDPRSAVLLNQIIACGQDLGMTLHHKPSG